MIRFVRPKYEVYVTINLLDKSTCTYRFNKSKSLGFFKSAEEAEKVRDEYLAESTTEVQFIADIKRLEPLNESI